MRAVALLVAVLAVTTTPALAATLPEGVYRCELYSGTMLMHLGDIAISNNSYQGPAFDGAFEGSFPFEVTDSGTINWGGPLGGFSTGGNTVVASVLTLNGTDTAFDITIQLESGNFSTVSCSPQ
jgi:hypothetical protein